MTAKKTQQLEDELKNSTNIKSFLNENDDILKKQDLSRYLRELIFTKKTSASQIIKKTGIEKSYFYQILKGRRKPGRDKILLVAISLGLTKDETQKLLKIGKEGSLYAKDRRDVVIQYCIINKFDVIKTQTYLDNNGFKILS